MKDWATALAGAAIGLGIAAAGNYGGDALVEARQPERVVSVKGLAEREVEADVATWRIAFRGDGPTAEEAVARAAQSRDAVRAFVTGGGVAEADLSEEPFALRAERIMVDNGASERTRFVAVGAIRVRSADVAAVDALAGRTLALLQQGVALGENDYAEAPRPQYAFTALNAIKPDMIAEATRAARDAADRFAADSGARVGAIVRANQGVVQILPRDPAFPEPLERLKLVRVVASVDYRLRD